MEKQFYPHINNDFRAYSKFLSKRFYFEFGIEKRIKIFGINIWVPIKKYYGDSIPKIKVGCVNYPFYKLVDLLEL